MELRLLRPARPGRHHPGLRSHRGRKDWRLFLRQRLRALVPRLGQLLSVPRRRLTWLAADDHAVDGSFGISEATPISLAGIEGAAGRAAFTAGPRAWP